MVSYITKQDGLQECLHGTQMSGNIRSARELVVAHEATTSKSATSLPPPACCHQPEPGATAWRHQAKSLNQKSKIKNQKSKIKNQKSKIKNQKLITKNQKQKTKPSSRKLQPCDWDLNLCVCMSLWCPA
jgi:hypothetical protein